jgi:recombination DNA repair RAD52 pathway protein
MDSIEKHIQNDIDILNNPTTSSQQRRHTQEELQSLVSYKKNHPEEDEDPSALDLYCDENPSADECRMYDV